MPADGGLGTAGVSFGASFGGAGGSFGGAGSGGGLTVSQPANRRSKERSNAASPVALGRPTLRRDGDSLQCGIDLILSRPGRAMDGFWLLLLEAGVALALLLFIVWWTWPRGKRRDDDKPES
ncbi:hypothetical protein D3C83_42150 [compost metagenome]